ncbi:helix-turn-helix transcriptional regulator [Mycobacterium intracellulare]|uniref:helix-turn-helix transcriptional regulator n=1 Tax=Mycobacterium intracellulare TaxID=1767 RepID=UPI001CDAA277|nr:helix-turn-helix domain-containing protein [Mycobacterium intracellulare]
MTHPEWCEKARITQSTGYYWRQIGKGPKAARIGKQLLYRRADVDAWLDSQFAGAGA